MITVEDYLKEKVYITQDGIEDVHDSLSTVKDAVIELIQLHVTEALTQASEKAEITVITMVESTDGIIVDKQSILNAYPLENIK
jgi:hypothetical protein